MVPTLRTRVQDFFSFKSGAEWGILCETLTIITFLNMLYTVGMDQSSSIATKLYSSRRQAWPSHKEDSYIRTSVACCNLGIKINVWQNHFKVHSCCKLWSIIMLGWFWGRKGLTEGISEKSKMIFQNTYVGVIPSPPFSPPTNGREQRIYRENSHVYFLKTLYRFCYAPLPTLHLLSSLPTTHNCFSPLSLRSRVQ